MLCLVFAFVQFAFVEGKKHTIESSPSDSGLAIALVICPLHY